MTPRITKSIPDTVAISTFLQSSSSPDRLALLGKLAACTAHDLNNLLTIIQIHASNVEAASTSPPDCVESGRQISSACRRCAELVRRILLFSKGRSDAFKPVAVDDLLPELTALMEPLLRRSRSVDLHFPKGGNLTIHGNLGGLEQIFINLLLNAAEAMDGDGSITVRCERVSDGLLTGSNQQFVKVSIRDCGPGIPKDIQERIFESSFTTKENGNGVGLAIVRDWVERHNGWITIDSNLGEGTEFCVWFPAIEEVPSLSPGATPAKNPAAFPLVLMVEDDSLIRKLGAQILNGADFRVIEVESAEEALAVWERHHADIAMLFTDIVLGQMDGRALAKRLRQDRSDLPLMFTSGYFSMLGGHDLVSSANFLPKPYHPHKLIEMAKSACGLD